MKTQAIVSTMIAMVLVMVFMGTVQAQYTIDPIGKGWAVHDPVSDSFEITVKNTGDTNPVILEVTPASYTYEENVTTFTPIPADMIQYVTITPTQLELNPNETGIFTVHIAMPDIPQVYNQTWEMHLLFNDSNPYNLKYGDTKMTQVTRMYMPDGRPPIPPPPLPLYIYATVAVVAIVLIIFIGYALKKRTLSVAKQDTPLSHNEWSPLALNVEEGVKEKTVQTPLVDATVLPSPIPAVKIERARVVKPHGTVIPYRRKA